MAATATFTCVCGVQKKVSNHWILAKCTTARLELMPWDHYLALEDDIIVLCGERCATALLSRCLGDWKQADSVSVANEPMLVGA
ncbi:hypothetical protein BDD14_3582 [Edaphobacter modestus]|uniref:Uncharacterized protein n=1 Tax=Edaphobacter modestus TaxID=388466 RepID=A0A4Q7YWH7_9BACT|nr:hypothetical protein BDD14_3582 [Edaphobacter modestus]